MGFRADQITGSSALFSGLITVTADLALITENTHVATKAYVDSVAQGLSVKSSVRVATTAALSACTYDNGASGVGATLTGDANGALGTIDTIADLAQGERLLVKNQSAGLQNGIYLITQLGDASNPFILTRATDNDEADEIAASFAFVEEGDTNGDAGFVCTSDNTVTMGTTVISWAQFSGAGQVEAGAGLDKTGNTIFTACTDTSLTINANDIQVNASTGLEVSTGLRLAAQGNGIAGGAGSTLSVNPDTTTGANIQAVNVTVNGVGLDIADIAGNGLVADGSANLDINLSATGGLELDNDYLAVTAMNATAATEALADTDRVLFNDISDSNELKYHTMLQLYNYVSTSIDTNGLTNALTGGNGIGTFSYNGTALVGVDVAASEVAGDGLKAGANAWVLDIEPADFAGAGLVDDGSDNLQINLSATGGLDLDNDYLRLDLNNLEAATIAVDTDSLVIIDATDSSTKKESWADIVNATVGTGLAGAAGVMSVSYGKVASTAVEGDRITGSTYTVAGSAITSYAVTHGLGTANYTATAISDDNVNVWVSQKDATTVTFSFSDSLAVGKNIHWMALKHL